MSSSSNLLQAKHNPFKAKTIASLLLTFSAPAMTGMLVNSLNNIISRIYIGHDLGALGIAAISIIFPVGFIFMAFSMLIGVGANALFSIRLGEKKHQEAELILGNAFAALVIIAVVLSSAGYLFLDKFLLILGASEAVLPYAQSYAKPLIFSFFLFSISLGLNNFIRSSGHPKTAMATQIISAVINLSLAPILIYKFKMGMYGAGLAVLCGQMVSITWVILYFISDRAPFKIRLKNIRLDFTILKDSAVIGIAQFVFQISGSALNLILNYSLLAYGGDLAISAIGIVISVNTIVIMPLIGISQGAQPLIGYNYGARKYSTAIQTLKMAIRWGIGITTAGYIIIQLFARPITCMFNSSDLQLIALSSHALRVYNLMLPIVALQVLATSFFQAINKPLKAAVLSLSRQILLVIPLVVILPKFFGLEGIFFAPPTADLISAILSYLLLNNFFKRHKQKFILFKWK